MIDKLMLKGLEFEGAHGWTEEERREGASFRVDISLMLDLAAAGESDDIKDTVDWRRIANVVHHIGSGTSFRLVEKLAGVIVGEVLQLCPAETTAELRLEKTSAVLDGDPSGAVVVIRRTRRQ